MGLQYEDLRTADNRDEYLRDSQRPVIIVRNVCEVCGLSSFDSQYSFFRHLKYHYEIDPITGCYPERVSDTNPNVNQRDLEGASGDDNEGFVNDNEQFEEIFANNINKSPDMIEHLEIFIKDQESRAEGYHTVDDRFAVIDDGMMMIEDSNSAEALAISETVQRVVELVDQEEAELPEATIGPLIECGKGTPLDLPTTIEIINDIRPESNQMDYRKIALNEEHHEIITEAQPALLPTEFVNTNVLDEEIVIEDLKPVAIQTKTVDKEVATTTAPSTLSKGTNKSNGNKKKMYSCTSCDRKYDSKPTLKYHLLTHSQRTFKCSYCDKLFLSKSTLNIHLRIHLETRPYTCPKCPMTFRQKTDLTHHDASIHTAAENYRYQCDVCKKKFARQYSLNLHSKLHTGEKEHKCEFCDKCFRASSYLKVHLRTHTKEKPYVCVTCSKGFAVKADLKRHIRQIHEKVDNETTKTKKLKDNIV